MGTGRVNRRYLRVYLYDHRGALLPPLMKSHKVSSALLPVMKIQGMRCYANALLAADHCDRRDAALKILLEAQMRASNTYKPACAAALVVCPDKETSAKSLRRSGTKVALTLQNSYLGSFAATGDKNQIWTGDVMLETLKEVEDHIGSCISYVRTKPLERLSERFDCVES